MKYSNPRGPKAQLRVRCCLSRSFRACTQANIHCLAICDKPARTSGVSDSLANSTHTLAYSSSVSAERGMGLPPRSKSPKDHALGRTPPDAIFHWGNAYGTAQSPTPAPHAPDAAPTRLSRDPDAQDWTVREDGARISAGSTGTRLLRGTTSGPTDGRRHSRPRRGFAASWEAFKRAAVAVIWL